MRRLDLKSGKLDSKDAKWYSLASRSHGHTPEAQRPDLPPDSQAIEAPFIVRHEGYYYLFVSFDLCCRGTKSNYKTMVGRSPEVMGPYMDATGRPMLQGGGTLLLSGNQRWVGPGGESILRDKDQDIMVFHAYDAKNGRPSLQISSIAWTSGWPRVALEGDGESK
jgi:arabinan endo-1,5-alpha-L-arabinosidase